MYILLLYFCFIIYLSDGTIDIDLAEYQFLADHLSERECHELVSALHFHGYEFPKDINAAERRLPEDVPCLDLLLHWNSVPREGRGQTHTEVCHRLNQIGRQDLAQWLSSSSFNEITKDLKIPLMAEPDETTFSPTKVTAKSKAKETVDEAAWWKMDSILEAMACTCILALCFGAIFLCCLCCFRKCKSRKDYTQLYCDRYAN